MTGRAALGTDVPQPQHCGAVGDDRHHVVANGQGESGPRVGGNRAADAGHARRVDHRQVVASLDRSLGIYLDLATQVQEECAIRHPQHPHAFYRAHPLDYLLLVVQIAGTDGDVAGDIALVNRHHVDGADESLCFADGRGDAAQGPRQIAIAQPHGRAVGRTLTFHRLAPGVIEKLAYPFARWVRGREIAWGVSLLSPRMRRAAAPWPLALEARKFTAREFTSPPRASKRAP